MASRTNIVCKRRKMRQAAAGRRRKNELRAIGSTRTLLALDKPNANERAQAARSAGAPAPQR